MKIEKTTAVFFDPKPYRKRLETELREGSPLRDCLTKQLDAFENGDLNAAYDVHIMLTAEQKSYVHYIIEDVMKDLETQRRAKFSASNERERHYAMYPRFALK